MNESRSDRTNRPSSITLKDLFIDNVVITGDGDISITGLNADSRKISSGMLFAALPGTQVDGVLFIEKAIAAGASAILCAENAEIPDFNVPVVRAPDVRAAFAHAASRFYEAQPQTVAAITGTSGKTSVAFFLQQIWRHCGLKSASLGTIGVVTDEGRRGDTLTTPEPVALHELLVDLHDEGITHLAMEASSHGIDQRRMDGVEITAAAFTNLGRDHMDYHTTVEEYFLAKARLFDTLLPETGTAVVFLDDAYGKRITEIAAARGIKLFSIGPGDSCALQVKSISTVRNGQALSLRHSETQFDIFLPLVGRFQALNALCAAGLAISCGASALKVFDALEALTGVPGRMEYVAKNRAGGSVFIDYAHKPEALEQALITLREATPGKIWVVFGAGGDRDPGKRPLMGQTAMRHADEIVVTDDNPRFEDPASIRAAILQEASEALEIADRTEAIRHALTQMGKNDCLLVAGKGHEAGQYIKGEVIAYSDHRAVEQILSEQRKAE